MLTDCSASFSGVQLHYDQATEAFRGEFRRWLADNLPTAEDMVPPPRSSADLPPWARAWQRRLFDAGWLVPGWPPERGGRNATPVQQMVYFEELARQRVPRALNPQGLSIVTPSILDWGSAAQQERWAMPTLRGEITWCLGMSEPGAGSDLAGLSTRAERRDDCFVVNGQKVWTSGAHDADWCFCFVRTDPAAPKHRGISVLVIDMKAEGITCRPLPSLIEPDRADFNEVFFTDVVVPRDHLVGTLNGGWPIAGGSLAHERGMLWIGQASGVERTIEGLVAQATSRRPDGSHSDSRSHRVADPLYRDDLAGLYIDSQALKLMGYRGFAKAARGMSSPEHSVLKLFGSELQHRLARTVVDALGARALDLGPGEEPDLTEGVHGPEHWAHHWLHTFAGRLVGGSSEIQRNIIAERVLGLPRG